ncbi:MAG: lysylphosphatidylglycerol synthase transmembrane domain-containing protein, partial [Puniceicoccales bacterium]
MAISKKSLFRVWQYLILLTLLVAGCIYFANNREQLAQLKDADWRLAIPLVILSAIANVSAALGYSALMRSATQTLSRWLVVKHFIIGRALTLVAPQGGTAYRAVAFNTHANLSYGKYAVTMIAFLWIEMLIISALLLICLMATGQVMHNASLSIASLLFFILCLFAKPAMQLAANIIRKSSRIPTRLGIKLSNAVESLHSLVSNPRTIVEMTFYAVINAMVHASRLIIAFTMFGNSLYFWHALVIILGFKAVNTFSITPGNLGILEVMAAMSASMLGV